MGATGATGLVFVERATAAGHDLVFQVRQRSAARSPLGKDPRARIFELSDGRSLADAMAGCEAAASFVGTERKRFDTGDTYESSDIASTQQLVDGAKAAHVPRVLLQSSMGAGARGGAYLRAKARCEAIVKESGLRWTIWRPSALVSPENGPPGTHGARRIPAGVGALVRLARAIPGLTGFVDDLRPIPIAVVCDAVLRVLIEPRDGATLSGRDLWALA
jgi:uncharacterized protein YbjT (DUF2867 family)